METIQIALSDTGFSQALKNQLAISETAPVRCVERPDPSDGSIIVLDFDHLEMLPRPIEEPERVVLIAGDGPDDLERAWQAGVQSVVSHAESINTAVLAVLAACLQASQSPARRHLQ
ncbi:MAG: hypothetical protein GY953_03880 [bacterium]|nr:hypothetical protein [bacterium]